ncbi:tryptophan/tyrosine permease family protein [Rickettsia bellii str. RML An4]|uniref:Tryptophan/tyrosine permease family protein n=2 Tax=Rickettsia TaxID=780 RepID=A0A0F3QEA5_RICBE|nr:aromatic amino acid transport family protein [Rickettsia bellii]KJV89759.1 tryptophan/tyrosine permease family protein [Rickettsia bellii str. RML An4]
MEKLIGSILLIAGTCIGSGMIALPMVLAKIGLIPSIILMFIIWFLMYYTSLINLELNLQAGKGLALGRLGRYFSGRIAEIIGMVNLKILLYALLAVFIYGGSSIIQNLLSLDISIVYIGAWYAVISILVLLLPLKLIDYINRLLFIGILIVIAILIIGLIAMIKWYNLPLFSSRYKEILVWSEITPVVFTSFGFQVIFHTLTNYCNKNARTLKLAFLFGTLIPAIVYIIWTCSVLTVIHHENPVFYQQMVVGNVEVGELVKELSSIAKWQSVQLLVWIISTLAIATSVIGVGVGLCDSLKVSFSNLKCNSRIRDIIAASTTILPAYIVTILIPNAFITVLGFAGMILVIIAILLPAYLLYKAKIKNFYYPELKKKYLIVISVIIGIFIMGYELTNTIIGIL